MCKRSILCINVYFKPVCLRMWWGKILIFLYTCCLWQTNLAHCVTYLSRASKSNEAYAALCNARSAVRQHRGAQPGVPLHLRNATTNLAHRMGLLLVCHVDRNVQCSWLNWRSNRNVGSAEANATSYENFYVYVISIVTRCQIDVWNLTKGWIKSRRFLYNAVSD